MRLKELFTVPAEQKVTERHMRRVLISSICSILLCMSCLVSTTWAWFAVSVENTGNVIQIAELTDLLTVLTVSQGETKIEPDVDGSFELKKNEEYTLTITRNRNTDGLNQDMKFYGSLVLSYTEGEKVNVEIYNAAITDSFSTTIIINTDAKLSVGVSWLIPDNGTWLTDDPVTVEVEEPADPTEESTKEPPATDPPTTEQPTKAPTEPPTEPPTEQPTEPPTEQPTETPTEQPTEAPTESTTEAPTNPETT